MRTYEVNEGEFVDFETLDEWQERDKSKDATIARLTAEIEQLRAKVGVAEAARRLAYDCDLSAGTLRNHGAFPTAEGILRQAADTLRALTEAGE